MANNPPDLSEIMTQLVVVSTQLANLKESIDKSLALIENTTKDHEERIREIEKAHGVLRQDITAIRERMTILNMMQVTLTGLVGTVSVWLAKK